MTRAAPESWAALRGHRTPQGTSPQPVSDGTTEAGLPTVPRLPPRAGQAPTELAGTRKAAQASPRTETPGTQASPLPSIRRKENYLSIRFVKSEASVNRPNYLVIHKSPDGTQAPAVCVHSSPLHGLRPSTAPGICALRPRQQDHDRLLPSVHLSSRSLSLEFARLEHLRPCSQGLLCLLATLTPQEERRRFLCPGNRGARAENGSKLLFVLVKSEGNHNDRRTYSATGSASPSRKT